MSTGIKAAALSDKRRDAIEFLNSPLFYVSLYSLLIAAFLIEIFRSQGRVSPR